MCDCITLMGRALEPHNVRLNLLMLHDVKDGKPTLEVRPQIQRCKVDSKKRKPLPALPAEYCPFCGDRYQWPDPKEMDDGHLKAELERADRQAVRTSERAEQLRAEWMRRDEEK